MNTIRMQVMAAGALLASGIGMTALASQDAAVGRMLYVSGDVTVLHNGKSYAGDANRAVYSGDVVRTGDSSQAQWRMGDQSYLAAWKSTSVKLAKFENAGKADYQLSQGGVRILAGSASSISLTSPDGSAKTQGGADFTAVVCKQSCYHNDGKLYPDGFYVKVAAGNVTISSASTAAASITPAAYVKLADARNSQAFGATMSDVAPLQLAANGSGLTVSGTTYVYVARGGSPATLTVSPDFFIQLAALNFKFDAKSNLVIRNVFDTGSGTGGSASSGGGCNNGSGTPTSPNC